MTTGWPTRWSDSPYPDLGEMKKGVIAHPLLKPQMEATYFFFFAAFLAAFLAAMVCNPPFRSRYCRPPFPTFCVDNKDMH